MNNTVYGATPIKRIRRTRSQINALRHAIFHVAEANRPCTLRQLFYLLVSEGSISKLETQYKAVGRLLLLMRREGEIPYQWIVDNTRWMRKPTSYSSLAEMLQHTAATYRRAVWDAQDRYVEIWSEKDSISGVIYPITAEFDVPLMPARGFSSDTFLFNAAEAIKWHDKPTFIYYFGDHDPSGVWVDRKVEAGLRRHAPGCDIHFVRIAVTREQIDTLQLPTRTTKKTDSRAKGFVGDSVEVDAIPPDTIRSMVRDCIEQHVDYDQLNRLRLVEEAERKTLADIAEVYGGDEEEPRL